MNEQLYRKVGRRYIPIGYSDGHMGFPTEGLWVVYKGDGHTSESCIAQVGKFRNIDYELMANLVVGKQEKITRIIQDSAPKSAYEKALEILGEICRKDSEK